MNKVFCLAATAMALAGMMTLAHADGKLPKGATPVKAGSIPVPVNSRDRALVKKGHLKPTYNFLTMEQCNSIFFCTCFMTGGDGGVTCYTLSGSASQATNSQ